MTIALAVLGGLLAWEIFGLFVLAVANSRSTERVSLLLWWRLWLRLALLWPAFVVVWIIETFRRNNP